MAAICGFSPDPSFTVTEHAMTGRDTPVARPRAEIYMYKINSIYCCLLIGWGLLQLHSGVMTAGHPFMFWPLGGQVYSRWGRASNPTSPQEQIVLQKDGSEKSDRPAGLDRNYIKDL